MLPERRCIMLSNKEALAELTRIQETYKEDDDFRRYVDKYCKSKNVQVDVALQHKTVREVGRYYAEENMRIKTAKIFGIE